METFTPQFAAFWLGDPEESSDREPEAQARSQSLSPSQREALEELAERINAARSVL